MIMVCGIPSCRAEHPYTNPKQFSSWMRRHRKTKHPEVTGRIAFRRKSEPRRKQWKDHGMNPPCNPRVMLELPIIDAGNTRIFIDRKTGIIWKYSALSGHWHFYTPPAIRTNTKQYIAAPEFLRRTRTR